MRQLGAKERRHCYQFDEAEGELKAAEDKESPVELAADADVQPDAVVIEAEATLVAGVAVFGRSVDIQIADCTVNRPSQGISSC